jgi:hypothetical protein
MNHQGDYDIHLREHAFVGEQLGVKSFFQPAHHATASSEVRRRLAGSNISTVGVNSNSLLVALMDSHYIEQWELVEKVMRLEDAVGRGQSSP